jgi:predicted metalloendopeptidase
MPDDWSGICKQIAARRDEVVKKHGSLAAWKKWLAEHEEPFEERRKRIRDQFDKMNL